MIRRFFRKAISIFPLLKNPYFVTIFVYAIWMIFFDENNLLTQWKRYSTLKELKAKESFYRNNINSMKEQLAELQTNSALKEKFAREHYYMKRDNEDVFVFIDKEPEKKQAKPWWQKIF
ncbi:MAG: septum formation initiator family protein [Chitinophagales bacterium]|nr:septum formation initiator family protein [Chitinophagales bacterium]MDW8273525.1 septum formation initiator family protein [Chitinophagales bacterium]